MKNLFLTLLVIGAGVLGYFSFQTKTQIEAELAAIDAAESLKSQRNTELVAQTKATDDEEKAQKKAESALATTRSEIQNAKTDIGTAKRSKNDLAGEVEDLESQIAAKKDALENARKLLVDLFPGEEVNFKNFEEKFNKLESTLKELKESRDENQILVDQASKDLSLAEADVERRVEKQRQYQESLSLNSLTGLVTAVNADWGFAVVNVGLSDGIDPDSELLVVRSGQRIGRLAITSAENGQSIANILFDSLSSGAMVRPGDRVMLAKPKRGN